MEPAMAVTVPRAKQSDRQKNAMAHRNIFLKEVADLLYYVVVLHDGIRLQALDEMFRSDEKRKHRNIPRCHVYGTAGVPQNLYYSASVNCFDSVDSTFDNRFLIGTMNPMNLDTRNVGFIVSEFTVVCKISTMIEYLAKALRKVQAVTILLDYAKEKGIAIESMWLVRQGRELDICDVVGLPDRRMYDAVPQLVTRHIERHDVQYRYDDARKEDKLEFQWIR